MLRFSRCQLGRIGRKRGRREVGRSRLAGVPVQPPLPLVSKERSRKLYARPLQGRRHFSPGTAGSHWLLIAGLLLVCPVAALQADEYDRARSELSAKYQADLQELADWCDQRDLAEQARLTRDWLSRRDPDKVYVAMLPREVGGPGLAADASPGVVQWHKQFHQLRREQANSLESLARRAIRNGRASLALELVLSALRENPDHEAIRRLFGFQKYRNQWRSLWEIRKLRGGQVWHEQFGWLPETFVRRYENGQRHAGGRWVTAEEDTRLHRDILSGWDVETEHYTIRTNHSLEAGVQLGRKLERLYRVWKQLFLHYFATDAQVAALFDGRARGNGMRLPRHQVVYFRDRQDYNQGLRAAFPNIEMSIGVYWESTRRAYFFAGEACDDRTLFHEATHQLFHESRPVAPDVGARSNFWIVEGIALYMESLHQEEDCHVLGGFDDLRMVAARYRLLHDDFYIPLSDLTAMGREELQTHPRIATLYSQAAGLTHFLIAYDGGRYRDALVHYLSAVYSGRDDPNTLARLTGVAYPELDRRYREFIESAGMPALAESD